MNRWKAGAIHLGISTAIAVTVVTVMLLVWYPPPYFDAMGGSDLVLILVAVDVVLGPLVTLIIFDTRKPRRLIRLDLAVIGALQLAALAYGVGVLAEARPLYMVFAVDRFDVVSANEMREEELDRVKDPRFRGVSWGRPRLVAARSPAEPDEQLRVIESALAGADLHTFPQYYVPYETLAAEALKKSRPLERLRKGHIDEAPRIDAELARLGRKLEDTRYLPLKARKRDYSVLLDAKTGAVVGFLPIVPW